MFKNYWQSYYGFRGINSAIQFNFLMLNISFGILGVDYPSHITSAQMLEISLHLICFLLNDLLQIWACRKIRCFWVSHKNSSPNIGSEIEKPSKNNRSQWLSKKNCTNCDCKKVKKPSTLLRCYIKKICIASLSKIDLRQSLGRSFEGFSITCAGHTAWTPQGREGRSQAGPSGCHL